jgi:hypothetical protein
MAQTPEGRTKAAVKKVIDVVRENMAGCLACGGGKEYSLDMLRYWMPTPSAFGSAGLPDFIILFAGYTLWLEAKCDPSEGKQVMSAQQLEVQRIVGAQCNRHLQHLVVGDAASFDAFKAWIHSRADEAGMFWCMPGVQEVPWRTAQVKAKRVAPPVTRVVSAKVVLRKKLRSQP